MPSVKAERNPVPLSERSLRHPAFWVEVGRVRAMLELYLKENPKATQVEVAKLSKTPERAIYRLLNPVAQPTTAYKNRQSDWVSFDTLDRLLTTLDLLRLARTPEKDGGFADVYDNEVIVNPDEYIKQSRRVGITKRLGPRINETKFQSTHARGWIVETIGELEKDVIALEAFIEAEDAFKYAEDQELELGEALDFHTVVLVYPIRRSAPRGQWIAALGGSKPDHRRKDGSTHKTSGK
jgi:hypothetical protein